MIDKLGKLPPQTKVYCGHEYTVKNLEFALTVEPSNDVIKKHLEAARKLRADNKPTVPGTIADELATNPFMRVTQAAVLAHCNTKDSIEAMRIVRKEKDNF